MTVLDSPPISRREARRRDRRQAILEVAAQYFLENGYAATTMSAIAAKLGGSKGTLWSYFPSKEELFAACLDHKTTAYRERLAEMLDPDGDLAATLFQLGMNLLEKVTSAESIALHRLVVAEAGRFPEMGAIFFEHAPRHTRMMVAAFLAQAMDRGLLRRADPELAARTLMML
ncbi:TetR/AcrR family transcriptional regulator, partial [Sphingobium sp.]|uniref:TetR/AcrR family transcriptional regulator n=1 Tax=Sphingobium sp. TaxID=1912891 RepID=UPI0035C6ED94